ncbi:hypothetical protein DIPPA_26695 [Diplonema papillatum]|nr:hypothetical protein DIPPA_26695 [Diplonema papillatum]
MNMQGVEIGHGSIVPDEVVQLYNNLPAVVQELINEAGVEAKNDGQCLELRVAELESLTRLADADVGRAAADRAAGQGAADVVKGLLARAAAQRKADSPSPARQHSSSSPRSALRVTLSPGPGQISVASVVHGLKASIPRQRSSHSPSASRGGRSRTPGPQSTRAYHKVSLEYLRIKQLARDPAARGPDEARFGLPQPQPTAARRSRSLSPAPESLLRHELVAECSPNSIAGRLITSRNCGNALRSRTPRMQPPRPAVSQQLYSVPGLVDELRLRNKFHRPKADVAFGSSSAGAGFPAAYLPPDIRNKINSVSRQERIARLTAASKQDAGTILQNARRYRSVSPGRRAPAAVLRTPCAMPS